MPQGEILRRCAPQDDNSGCSTKACQGIQRMNFRLAVDVGGTFTDIALADESVGRISIVKVPSTPSNPALGVIQGIRKIIDQEGIQSRDIGYLIHGTTVATNCLLTHTGARVALITTEGFRDALHIGRQARPSLYDFWARRSEPLVPRQRRYEVPERTLYDGSILKELDRGATEDVVRRIVRENVEAIAVCLINSYANPTHEQIVAEVVAEQAPDVVVSISSEVLPEFREFERMSTVVVNSYVMPRVSRYVDDLSRRLQGIGLDSELYIMQSNGGVITSHMASRFSARTILSGPAGGALAGVHLARVLNKDNLITIDMGGTSFDVCLIHRGDLRFTTDGEISGYRIKLPMIDIHTIGAGGGSIAWVDSGGALRVGPQSAGADPGPACYSRGGSEATVTDANVVLGRINPAYLLDGDLELSAQGAWRAVEMRVARPLGMSVEAAARGIIAVVNASMVRAIRVISVERGYDPREFSLVAFGGAGPLHAVELARELDMPEVVVPVNPGATSAVGMLTADVRHDFVMTYLRQLAQLDISYLNEAYARLNDQAIAQLAEENIKEHRMVLAKSADMRYARQAYELPISIPSRSLTDQDLLALAEVFHNAHHQAYGYSRREDPVELVNIRVVALGKMQPLDTAGIKSAESDTDAGQALQDSRPVCFYDEYVETPVYRRARMAPGTQITGPAIVEQLDSTTVIFPGQWSYVDDHGNIRIALARGAK